MHVGPSMEQLKYVLILAPLEADLIVQNLYPACIVYRHIWTSAVFVQYKLHSAYHTAAKETSTAGELVNALHTCDRLRLRVCLVDASKLVFAHTQQGTLLSRLRTCTYVTQPCLWSLSGTGGIAL